MLRKASTRTSSDAASSIPAEIINLSCVFDYFKIFFSLKICCELFHLSLYSSMYRSFRVKWLNSGGGNRQICKTVMVSQHQKSQVFALALLLLFWTANFWHKLHIYYRNKLGQPSMGRRFKINLEVDLNFSVDIEFFRHIDLLKN